MILLNVLVLVAAAGTHVASAAPDNLADRDPQMLMAAGLHLTDLSAGEKQAFGEIIRTFAKELNVDMWQESNRNAPQLERRIKRKMRKMFVQLDEGVARIIAGDRLQGYQLFRLGRKKAAESSQRDQF